jgi:predicted GIY-YIG superfamily endonuclease
MQKITTREPDDEQLEIALSAMRAALQAEERLKTASKQEALALKKTDERSQVRVFRDFSEVPALAADTAR